jgi:hypothetical protein
LFCSAPEGSAAYFFCRFDVSESLTAKTIIGCLARQLLGQQPIDLRRIDHFWNNPFADPDEQVIVKFVRKLLPVDPIYSLIVDGLDECSEKERQMTLGYCSSCKSTLKFVCACHSDRARGIMPKSQLACLMESGHCLSPRTTPTSVFISTPGYMSASSQTGYVSEIQLSSCRSNMPLSLGPKECTYSPYTTSSTDCNR